MNNNIKNDMPVRYETSQLTVNQKSSVKTQNNVDKTSSTKNKVSVNSTIEQSNNIKSENNAAKIPSVYEMQQKRLTLEVELNDLLKQIMPDMGVKFKIHENTGQVITSVINNDKNEVVREFPAEKMLDIIYNMCQKLGVFVDRKI